MTSVFEHPWLSGLFADPEVAELWSAHAQLSHMIAFEAAWSRAGYLAGLWSAEEGEAAAQAIERAQISPKDLRDGTARDGVCVPSLVKLIKATAGDRAVHMGATSQDLIDTATVMSLVATLDLVRSRLIALEQGLAKLSGTFGSNPLMGRTRMQAAVEITVADRIATWQQPLSSHIERIDGVRARVARVQVGGAAGNRAVLGAHGDAVCASVAASLGLAPADRSWHAMRDGIAEASSLLSLITGTLGKMGQDISLMVQQGISELKLASGGGSSAMPHKQNPVLAELLVTLARFNAVQLSGMHQSLIHEQERSGAAWSLEWMMLPQMALATGRALVVAQELSTDITWIGTPQ